MFFQWDVVASVRKVNSAGAEVAFQQRYEKWYAAVARSTSKCARSIFEVPIYKNDMPLWHEANFKVKIYKILYSRKYFLKF